MVMQLFDEACVVEQGVVVVLHLLQVKSQLVKKEIVFSIANEVENDG